MSRGDSKDSVKKKLAGFLMRCENATPVKEFEKKEKTFWVGQSQNPLLHLSAVTVFFFNRKKIFMSVSSDIKGSQTRN